MDLGSFSDESLEAVEEMLYEFSARNAQDIYLPARKKQCPPGTFAVGGGFCKNPKPDRAGYIQAVKKRCPPNTDPVGAGWCKVTFQGKT